MDDVVLAVDDDQVLLEMIQKVAKSTGFAVTAMADSTGFQSALSTRPPSVVLLDLQLPDCDGIELLRGLADAGSQANIILMSGYDARVLGMAQKIGQGLGLEMGQPLEKPFRLAELRQVLQKIRGKSYYADAADLREAIDNDRLELFYQPVVTLDTGKTIGFEALVRWRHPEFGIVMPERFISLAERENLINPLTDRVFELAASQIAQWQKVGIDSFVSVNVSATNIVASLPDDLVQLCSRHRIPPRSLRLELTESAAMGNSALMSEVLTRVRLKGFQLAIDDFGTGYSSLVQLHHLPFSELKIDQSFVREMASSADASLIVSVIVNLGHGLHLELIAEGIETEHTKNMLIGMGCKTGQGYFFSRPMPAGAVTDWVARHPIDAMATA
ncbi:MAG TPA: EAL domain-containing response regulator [Micropepsaceae bacterium]|nr:EAL domain-containing response regulator [Micropepsaceae bacterium]